MNRLLIFILLFLLLPSIDIECYDGSDFYPDTIKVQFDGEVIKKGVYSVKQGSTIGDMIDNHRISFKKTADTSSLNLNYILSDQDVIVVDRLTEESLISINNASVAELCELDGIGESTAAKIIEYREENGRFRYLEELMLINGIKEAKFNKIRKQISL